jgi:O-6-methylguanine DNA methyltransferase
MRSIRVNGVEFEVEASSRGLTRLRLPAMGRRVRDIAGSVRPEASVDLSGLEGREAACLQATAVFLTELLQGREPGPAPEADVSSASGFTSEVLATVGRIPWGTVSSYAAVAESSGHEGAYRAVGGAVGRNPVPLVIPCHRVVRSDGGTGGWSGAPGWKEWLLELERTGCRAPAESASR